MDMTSLPCYDATGPDICISQQHKVVEVCLSGVELIQDLPGNSQGSGMKVNSTLGKE